MAAQTQWVVIMRRPILGCFSLPHHCYNFFISVFRFPRTMAWLCSVVLLGAAVRCLGSHTQHLHPPVEIDPLPAMPRVTMPHMQPADMSAFISQAETAMSERFDNLEPAIYNKGKQCLV
jgi:hypothetical protein